MSSLESKHHTFISLYNTNHQSIIFSSNISMAIKSILIDFPVCGFGLSIMSKLTIYVWLLLGNEYGAIEEHCILSEGIKSESGALHFLTDKSNIVWRWHQEHCFVLAVWHFCIDIYFFFQVCPSAQNVSCLFWSLVCAPNQVIIW